MKTAGRRKSLLSRKRRARLSRNFPSLIWICPVSSPKISTSFSMLPNGKVFPKPVSVAELVPSYARPVSVSISAISRQTKELSVIVAGIPACIPTLRKWRRQTAVRRSCRGIARDLCISSSIILPSMKDCIPASDAGVASISVLSISTS